MSGRNPAMQQSRPPFIKWHTLPAHSGYPSQFFFPPSSAPWVLPDRPFKNCGRIITAQLDKGVLDTDKAALEPSRPPLASLRRPDEAAVVILGAASAVLAYFLRSTLAPTGRGGRGLPKPPLLGASTIGQPLSKISPRGGVCPFTCSGFSLLLFSFTFSSPEPSGV